MSPQINSADQELVSKEDASLDQMGTTFISPAQESVSKEDASLDQIGTTFISPAQESPLPLELRPTELQLQVDAKVEGLITPVPQLIEAELTTTNGVCNHLNGSGVIAELSPQVGEQPISKDLILHESATSRQDPICKLFQQGHQHKENDENVSDLPEIAAVQESKQREATFRDMGFSSELIQRALQLHGAEADDSTLVQFLLDHGETGPDWIKKIKDELEGNFPRNVKTEDSLNSVLKPGSSSGGDSMNQKCVNWAAPLAELCKSKGIPPDGSGHRDALQKVGFPHNLIQQAILDLGEDVEYATLFEYVLCLKSQQDSEASTSTGPSPFINNQVTTMHKLVTEYGFPKKAVERAVQHCKTPEWDVKEDEMVDVLDYLAAYRDDLNMWASRKKQPFNETHLYQASRFCEAHPWRDNGVEEFLQEEVEEDEVASESDNSAEENLKCEEDEDAMFWKWLHEKEEVMTSNLSTASQGKRDRSQIDVTQKSFAKGGRPAKFPRFAPNELKPTAMRKNPRADSIYDGETLGHPRGFRGFGLPGKPPRPRHLKEDLSRPPYFYFENVASMPKDEWERIQRHLFDLAPEFVDALHFSACRRPRGYIHNLPLAGRRKILADPPMTIQELLPQTKPFWPPWDTRTKLNCISTHRGQSKKLYLRDGHARLTPTQQHEILQLCRRLNLVWTAPNVPTPIDYHEIEAMLGFDRDHSRPCVSITSRYQVLGNSFSIYTIAFHFSVLQPLYPRGIKVLSLFTGIGGAEVALHKIGIKLLVVVSVEIDEGAQRCLEAWWRLTKQSGILNQNYHNVKDLGREELTELVRTYGGFDFIVGGSPCQNLSANNRVSRTGLEGSKSIEFFEFSRIVSAVRELTMKFQQDKVTI